MENTNTAHSLPLYQEPSIPELLLALRKKNINPIEIPPEIQSLLYRTTISPGIMFNKRLKDSANYVFKKMCQESLLTPGFSDPYIEVRKTTPFDAKFSSQINLGQVTYAPDKNFAYCQNDLNRLGANPEITTGYSLRNPNKSHLGGSAKLLFSLRLNSGDPVYFIIYGASRGLKEWENLAFLLGTLYHAGFFQPEDDQLMEIICEANLLVKNDFSAQPRGMNIVQYVRKVFDAIGWEKAPLT